METIALDESAARARSKYARARRAVEDFFFAKASARPLAALRIGVSVVLLAQAAMVRTEIIDWFSHDGLFRGDLASSFAPSFGPRLDALVSWLSPFTPNEASALCLIGAVYVAALLLLALGLGTRLAAFVAWFLHWTLMNSADPLVYGVDRYAHIFLFYLIVVPSGRTFSLPSWFSGHPVRPTETARLGLRVMQIHLALSYFASGIEKAGGIDWWSGDLIFRAFSLPDYQRWDMSWLATFPLIAQLACLTTLTLEIGYCVFIWPKRTRTLWLSGIVGLHLGIAVLLGLHFFGAMMCVLNVALFGISAEPPRPGRNS